MKTGYYPLKTQSNNYQNYTIFRTQSRTSVIISGINTNTKEPVNIPISNCEMHVESFQFKDYNITLRMVGTNGMRFMYRFKTDDNSLIAEIE